jgi:L-alanine-DL-glutamate epimerase-like enolase superfamily enzyme
MAALAEAYHVQLAPHGASLPDLHAHLAAALPHTATIPATTPGQPPELYSRLWQDFRVDQGKVHLSNRPGLGSIPFT